MTSESLSSPTQSTPSYVAPLPSHMAALMVCCSDTPSLMTSGTTVHSLSAVDTTWTSRVTGKLTRLYALALETNMGKHKNEEHASIFRADDACGQLSSRYFEEETQDRYRSPAGSAVSYETKDVVFSVISVPTPIHHHLIHFDSFRLTLRGIMTDYK